MDTNKCTNCNTNPILVKKRGLCNNCYQSLRRSIGPFKNNLTPLYRWIDLHRGLRKRFGDEFIHDLLLLKITPFKTLAQVGDKYNVTNEYIRQIFNNYFGYAYTKAIQYKQEKVSSDILPCTHDPRHRIAESPKGSYSRRGAKHELEFWKLCEQRGFDVQNSCSKSIDLVVNGFNVDVKSCKNPNRIGQYKTAYYRYGASKNEIAENDFFACYRPDMDKYVIIPNTISKCYQNGRFWIYMNVEKSNWPSAQNKYWEYIERYDLLELQN